MLSLANLFHLSHIPGLLLLPLCSPFVASAQRNRALRDFEGEYQRLDVFVQTLAVGFIKAVSHFIKMMSSLDDVFGEHNILTFITSL